MKQMKLGGIVLVVVAAICLFVAFERYQANANSVKAMNQSIGGGIFQAMNGGDELEPSIPTVTKYALLGAVIFGAAGGYCLLNAKSGT